MNYNEFLTKIEKEMNRLVGPNRSITIRQVTKNNNTVYDALIVYDPLINISPSIYLNPYYHRLLDGIPIEDIISDIYLTYKHYMPNHNVDTDTYTDYEKCRNQIIMKLISYDHNKELLEDVPHMRWMDMAIIFQCFVPGPDGSMGTITIHKDHAELLHADREKLFGDALVNTPSLLPCYFANIRSCIKEISDSSSLPLPPLPVSSPEKDMYVLSNTAKVNGAVAIFYPHIMEKIADILDSSYYILPSSVNELLILPCENEDLMANELLQLTNMVHEVNETEISDEEYLSNQAYFYNRSSGDIVSNAEANAGVKIPY